MPAFRDGSGAVGVERPSTVSATPAAADWLRRLVALHGELVLFQSGGCCDGSSPMLWPRADFRIGDRDVRLGALEGVAWWIGGDQYERWKHTRLTLDVVKGRGAGFSLEAPEGVRFLVRSDLCTPDEVAAIEASPLPRGSDLR